MSDNQKFDLFFETVEKVKTLANNCEMGFYTPDEAIWHLTSVLEGLAKALESNQE